MSSGEKRPLPPEEGGGGDFGSADRSGYERIADLLVRISAWAAMAVIIVMMVLVTTDMMMRSFADRSLMMVEEVVGQLTVAMAFLGAPYALRRHALLRVDIFRERLSPRGMVLLDMVFNAASLVYVGLVIWFGIQLVRSSLRLDIVSMTWLQTPMWIPQMVLPVGGGLLALALVAEQMRDLRRLRALSHGQGKTP